VIAHLSSFGAGLLFGIGLWISGLAIPRKMLAFLDVSGSWDPSLLLVMAGAVGVTLAAFRPTLRREKPFFAGRFIVPSRTDIDVPLVAGAALFGLGWGIAGYCPGPALTALSNVTTEVFAFVAAMVAGGFAHKLFESSGLPAAAGST
jgi:uncharacterized membrane protein YedE/YeeE